MRHSERAPPNHTALRDPVSWRRMGAGRRILHNLSTLLRLANGGRPLRFQEPLPRI
jgi:hypothetical protein